MSSYFDITENSHKNMNIENHYKSMHFSVLLKTPLDLQQNSMFYSNKIQNNKKKLWYIKNKIYPFLLQSAYNSSYTSPKLCV
jgi:hypothetical protein